MNGQRTTRLAEGASGGSGSAAASPARRQPTVRLAAPTQADKENTPRLRNSSAASRRTSALPLRGILKSPGRDITAPVNATRFFDDDLETDKAAQTINITQRRRQLRRSVGRRVSFAAKTSVRLIDPVEKPWTGRLGTPKGANRRQSFASPEFSFASDNGFSTGQFEMPDLYSTGGGNDGSFNLRLSLGGSSAAADSDMSMDMENTSNASIGQIKSWHDEYEVQLKQSAVSSSPEPSSPGTSVFDAPVPGDSDSDTSNMSFASDLSVASPFDQINENTSRNQRRASMGTPQSLRKSLLRVRSPGIKFSPTPARSTPLRQSFTSATEHKSAEKTLDATSAAIISPKGNIKPEFDVCDDEETDNNSTDEEPTNHVGHTMAMETTRCVGGILSRPPSMPADGAIDMGATMEITRCIGGIRAQREMLAAEDDNDDDTESEAEYEHTNAVDDSTMVMDMTRCVGGILAQQNTSTAADGSVSSADEDDADAAESDAGGMDMTRCIGAGIHSQQSVFARTDEDTVPAGAAHRASTGTRAPATPIQDVWMGAPAAVEHSYDEMTMEVTRCVGGILQKTTDPIGDDEHGAENSQDMDMSMDMDASITSADDRALRRELSLSLSAGTPSPKRTESLSGELSSAKRCRSSDAYAGGSAVSTPQRTRTSPDLLRAPSQDTFVHTPSAGATPATPGTDVHPQDITNHAQQRSTTPQSRRASEASWQALTRVTTPRNNRVASNIKQALLQATPGRLTPARLSSAPLRSARTSSKRIHTFTDRLQAMGTQDHTTLLETAPDAAHLGVAGNDNVQISASTPSRSKSVSPPMQEPVSLFDAPEDSLLDLTYPHCERTESITQALEAALAAPGDDLFSTTRPIHMNEASFAASVEPDVTGHAAEQPEISSQAALVDLSQDLSRDELANITLQSFLQMVGIQFMDRLTTTKRRETLPPSASSASVTSTEQLTALTTLAPMAELYEFCCNELQAYIARAQEVNAQLETDMTNTNPALVEEYLDSPHERREDFERQLKLNKAYARAQTMETWYRWRGRLYHPILAALQNHLDRLTRDTEILNGFNNRVGPIMPKLRKRHNNAAHQLQEKKTRQEEIAKCDSEQLASLEEAIDEQSVQLAGFRENLARIDAEKQTLNVELAKIRAEIQATRKAVDEANAARAEARCTTLDDLQESRVNYELVTSAFGCKINALSKQQATLLFDSHYTVTIDFAQGQIVSALAEDVHIEHFYQAALHQTVPFDVAQPFVPNAAPLAIQNALHTLVRFDALLDDVRMLDARHRVEQVETACHNGASACLISARVIDGHGLPQTGVQFRIDTLSGLSDQAPRWELLTGSSSASQSAVAKAISGCFRNQRGALTPVFHRLTRAMDAVRTDLA
ncbi:Spc7 kinetochore protein-domain-containing protein [Thamnocephalis sphaerospora]|uniref:Spc7 kinetochore protein-domain-containing protein n=1 Tax=Thamnocephalis sphaerospora TaxID=78915 RepID=A0A4V1IX45_9FUNG|nr:Spc7 kinetochore protein-domain-containing protein [Thamnocephalis sphaerospora]|eukprot:RKP09779.1 Spc7 kinetochore protein-domain-containing protein [Thamnocephalis sphaerospora]